MKPSRLTAFLLIVTIALTGFVSAGQEKVPGSDWGTEYENDIVRGRVLEVSEIEDIEDDWFYIGRQFITVEITSGPFRGQIEELENRLTGIPHRDLDVKKGAQVLLFLELDGGRLHSINLYDVARDSYLYILLAGLIFIIILVTKTKGIKTLSALIFIGFVIVRGLLPLILQGYNPLALTVLFTSLVTVVAIAIIGGVNARSAAAMLGTAGGVLVAGVLTWVFGTVIRLTGLSEGTQTLYLADLPLDIDVRGLLFAGIIIGALGAIMEMAMSVAASVAEQKKANPLLTTRGLFQAGLHSSKALLGSRINTLILAYFGGILPLLLLFMANGMNYTSIINMDLIATEILRAIAGSLGLLAAVPLTAWSAAWLFSRLEAKRSS